MGNPKQKWTPEEEDALRRGISKYGPGKWQFILRDPQFRPVLHNRSNIDLKDKWRNMSVSVQNGPRGDKSRAQRLKELVHTSAVPPRPRALPPRASSTPVSKEVKKDPDTEDPSECVLKEKSISTYNAMICEALSTLNEPEGSATTSIIKYFEKKGEVLMNAQKFRKMISTRLRRLVASGKILKLPNSCYKLNTEYTVKGTKSPVPKRNNAQPKAELPQLKTQPPPQPKAELPRLKTVPPPQPKAELPQLKTQPPLQPKARTPPQPAQPMLQATQAPIHSYLGDSIKEASLSAALILSDAENKSFMLAEAVRESERVAVISEESERMLDLAIEISHRSSHGEVVLLV